MHLTAADEAVAAALQANERAQPRCGVTTAIAVDGPSGAGRPDFVDALAVGLAQARTLHLDVLYPGWDGLEQGVADLVVDTSR
jgi:hypothetical protein